jgi:hypothetical protein
VPPIALTLPVALLAPPGGDWYVAEYRGHVEIFRHRPALVSKTHTVLTRPTPRRLEPTGVRQARPTIAIVSALPTEMHLTRERGGGRVGVGEGVGVGGGGGGGWGRGGRVGRGGRGREWDSLCGDSQAAVSQWRYSLWYDIPAEGLNAPAHPPSHPPVHPPARLPAHSPAHAPPVPVTYDTGTPVPYGTGTAQPGSPYLDWALANSLSRAAGYFMSTLRAIFRAPTGGVPGCQGSERIRGVDCAPAYERVSTSSDT